jgi:hypothetical protein
MKMLQVVTGASSNHFCPLKNLIRSIHTLSDPLIKLEVFDLGLSTAEVNELTSLRDGAAPIIAKKLDFSCFPDFFNIQVNAGCYAWKPAVINASCSDASTSMLVWLDAGCIVQPGFREAWLSALSRSPIISPRSSGTIQDWAHPACVRALGIGQEVLKKPNLSGGVVGFNLADPRAKKLLSRWLRWAHDRSVIAPHGSSRDNHRQDQTLLSILIAQSLPAAKPMKFSELCVSVHRDDDGC